MGSPRKRCTDLILDKNWYCYNAQCLQRNTCVRREQREAHKPADNVSSEKS